MNEELFLKLISGETTGAVPTVLKAGLSGLSLFYRCGVSARNLAFDIGLKRTWSAPVPVISVGNLTTGGTGKTPFVAWLANWFQDQSLKPGLLSRGYRSLDNQSNDEKLLLDNLCPGVPHLQDPDRCHSAQFACEEYGTKVLILDDGFQHRKLNRQLDIVLIDALNPWGFGALLPRGLLREPMSSLNRASLVVLTRVDQVPPEQLTELKKQITRTTGQKQIVEVAFPPQQLINAVGDTKHLDEIKGARIYAFCGIGNPQGFKQTLEKMNGELLEFQSYPDHYHYSESDLQEISEKLEQHNADFAVTTHKDLVKIPQNNLGTKPLWALQIGCQIIARQEFLDVSLENIRKQIVA